MGSWLSLAVCLVLAFFIVKGFLSWLADVAIWALRVLETDNSLAPTDPGSVHRVVQVQEPAQGLEKRQPFLAPERIESARSHAGPRGVWTEPQITEFGIAATPSEGQPMLLDVTTGRSEAAPLIGPETGSHYENHCDYTLARLHTVPAGHRDQWYGVTWVKNFSSPSLVLVRLISYSTKQGEKVTETRSQQD